MKERLELVKFNLTPNMTIKLIKFNELKKQLVTLKNKEMLDKNDLIKIEKLKNELNTIKINFIKEFRDNNKEEINRYLQIKDQF